MRKTIPFMAVMNKMIRKNDWIKVDGNRLMKVTTIYNAEIVQFKGIPKLKVMGRGKLNENPISQPDENENL